MLSWEGIIVGEGGCSEAIAAEGEDICAGTEPAPVDSSEAGEDIPVEAAIVAGDDGALAGADGDMSPEAGGAAEEIASGEGIGEAGLIGAVGDDAAGIDGCAAVKSHDVHTVVNLVTGIVTVNCESIAAEGEAMSDEAEGATAFAVLTDGTSMFREAVPAD